MTKLVFGSELANTIAKNEPELLPCPFCGGYLAELRSLAEAMQTPANVYAFVARCLDHGIDPI